MHILMRTSSLSAALMLSVHVYDIWLVICLWWVCFSRIGTMCVSCRSPFGETSLNIGRPQSYLILLAMKDCSLWAGAICIPKNQGRTGQHELTAARWLAPALQQTGARADAVPGLWQQ
jgi:hypothetical protein